MPHAFLLPTAAKYLTVLAVALTVSAQAPRSQAEAEKAAPSSSPVDARLLGSMKWRLVGPFRGGRSAAVCGVIGQRKTYYFGATGGGVWKTVDSGRSWKNVSDGFFGGSIGAVAVAPSDPNVLYVGGGEKTVRGNVSHGDGMWKSLDAGKTWVSIGLANSHHISRLRVHPKNPDLVYAAVLGRLYGPSPERGVYRSTDGGKSWARVLFANADAGAVDLSMDPSNPRVLYASTWRVRRTPYSLSSGGEGSALWKSSDGGDTWKKLSENKGMPKGTLGIIGVSVCPSKAERVYAIVEAAEGGVLRSDDGGETWSKVNSERKLRQRAWYYSRIFADPVDADVCYVANVGFWRSKDGGKSYTRIRTPHGDNHDLWIDPEDPKRMIEANDGGACVTDDGGRNWSPLDNQPTAQFYRVTTDHAHPYRILGGQQDNSTVRIASRGRRGSIGESDWSSTAGGESAWIATHPRDPDIVFGGSYGGYLTRVNHRTNERRSVNIWPRNPMGHGAGDLKYRFQWNFPIVYSQHAPHELYAAAQVLFRTSNDGQSWEAISPDLTRNDKSMLGASGGPITKDNTGVEYYATIFAFAESPRKKGVLWCGTDEGLVHVTRDGGKTWKNVTPKALPEWAQINCLEAHPFVEGGVYLAATRYKSDDFQPLLFASEDFGATWRRCDTGIKRTHFTRAIRADRTRRGLLYAGTERGVYVSFDDGKAWQSLQGELPIVPVTDLAVKENDLIAATQGRSFWVLDDLTPLQQMKAGMEQAKLALLAPRPAWRNARGSGQARGTRGGNPPSGLIAHYWLAKKPSKDAPLKVEVLDSSARVIRRFSTHPAKDDKASDAPKVESLKCEAGMNRFTWNLRYPGAKTVPGMVLWGGGLGGPLAVPGSYQLRFTLGDGDAQVVEGDVFADPHSSASQADLEAQFAFLIAVREKLSETHEAILEIRRVRKQLKALRERGSGLEKRDALEDEVARLEKTLTTIEEALYQTKNRSAQDPLNFPIRLNNELSALVSVVATGSWRPTDQAEAVRKKVTAEIDAKLQELESTLAEALPRIEDQARQLGVPALSPRPKRGASSRAKAGSGSGR